jgi:Ca-activated chloride channel family protein
MDFSQNYYAILGVPPAASEEGLRQAYRMAARRFHPDVNKAPGAALLFKDINTAYEVLSAPRSRAEYDQVVGKRLSEPPSLLLQTSYSRSCLKRMDEPQLLYILVKIQPVLEMSLETAAPLNLCLVIDRSTSMRGERLQNVKLAVRQLLDATKPEDVISIVSFSDDAEVLIPAQRQNDPRKMKAMVSTLRASGATAILSGLQAGLKQIERYRDSRYVNHIVLITDGRTYGDEEQCLDLAGEIRELGVSISGMGIGEDWHDDFLDALATKTGGSSVYVAAPHTVNRFLQERVRSLATACAERARLISAPATVARLNSVVRTSPDSMTLPFDSQPIPLGTIDGLAATSLLFQFHVDTVDAEVGELFIGRIDVSGQVLGARQHTERVVNDLVIEVGDEEIEEEPPPEILDALGNLMLYRLQDRAREALAQGDVEEATRKLEFLATRLFERGQESLGQTALYEAQRVAHTKTLSGEGAKTLKYGTRALSQPQGDEND